MLGAMFALYQDLSKKFLYWEVYHIYKLLCWKITCYIKLSSIFYYCTSANGANSFETLVPTNILNKFSKALFGFSIFRVLDKSDKGL